MHSKIYEDAHPPKKCTPPPIFCTPLYKSLSEGMEQGKIPRIPTSIFGEGPLFLLRARGESMVEAGIDDGDLVVAKQQNTARPGQIVVALIEDETTLKKYYPEPQKQRIRLQPANSRMKPMYFKDVTIQGVVVKIIKNTVAV